MEFQASLETVSFRVQRLFLLVSFRFRCERILPYGPAQTFAAVVPLNLVGPFGMLLIVAINQDDVRLDPAISGAGDGAEPQPVRGLNSFCEIYRSIHCGDLLVSPQYHGALTITK